ncbi:MAG: MerR family transcriptional regulator [Pseudomonadota bacterium]
MSSQAKSGSGSSKSEGAFRTISEVAAELQVPKHVLRFWELKFPQVRPMKRGGGRRYYRPEDARLLRGIRSLLYRDGYTIKGVQKILREQGIEAVKLLGEENDGAHASRPSAQEKSARQRTTQPQVVPGVVLARAHIERAIAELEACRTLLTGEASEQKPARGRSKDRTAMAS